MKETTLVASLDGEGRIGAVHEDRDGERRVSGESVRGFGSRETERNQGKADGGVTREDHLVTRVKYHVVCAFPFAVPERTRFSRQESRQLQRGNGPAQNRTALLAPQDVTSA